MASPDPYADFGKSPRARATAESEEWKAGKEQVFGVIDEMKALTEHWMTRYTDNQTLRHVPALS